MHHDPQRIIDRAERILRERIAPATEQLTAPLDVTVRDLPGEPEPFAVATSRSDELRPVSPDDPWGPAWTTSWFRVTGAVPAEWRARITSAADFEPAIGPLVIVIDLGFDPAAGPGFQCEGLVHTPEGRILKGIHPRSMWVPVEDGATDVDVWVEAAANPDIVSVSFRPTALGEGIVEAAPPLYRFRRADLVLLDPEVQALEVDLDVLLGWARVLPADRPRRARILAALDRACDALDLADISGTAAHAREILRPVLAAVAEESAHRIAAIGHAHIDSAWLWPTRETVRKATRTFSNVLDLMERYPEFRFAGSQAQQYAWVEEAHPALFARIREAVAKGRWMPVGGMWVESDTNMPGGEALVRQIVHGKRYFADRFGVEAHEIWLPDSFGYTAALPQIAALAGYRWFLTQKLSWNATNHFPHHTFRWQGIDGTSLFTHMPPVDNYLSELTAVDLDHAASNFRDHVGATTSVVPFGHGDGGGGPTAVMLERARRQADLEGSPAVAHATSEEFFRSAEEEYGDAPTWVGELYLETHRGTYTSQAAMKQGNRRAEHLLREAELWSATAALRLGVPYPYDELDRIWKVVLLHQFHDILPGSSIAWVHREAAAAYAAVTVDLERIVGAAIAALAGDGDVPVAFNAAPLPADGVPALGAAPRRADAGAAPVTVSCEGEETVLDNGRLRLRIDAAGSIFGARDLARGRELVAPGGRLNELVLYQDLPNRFDAWDIDEHYRGGATVLDEAEEVRVEQGADGAATLVVTRRFGASVAVQRATLRPGERHVDFDVDVDWHEAERLLKTQFALDLQTDSSLSEIQFGHVQRPTHSNTTWDWAKFEICAHRWVQAGEPSFGIAIANDSTYGHHVGRREDPDGGRPGTEIGLSLLRAPRFPDPNADQGRHTFRYRLVADAGVPEAVEHGYRLNLPLREVRGVGEVLPLLDVSRADGRAGASGVLVESLKLAEDRSGDLVVRLYESRGERTVARIGWDVDATRVSAVDLLEREQDVLEVDGRSVVVEFRPFQILTVRLSAPTVPGGVERDGER
jgi:alpha-mannosidase